MKITLFEVPEMERSVFLEMLNGIDISFYTEKLDEKNIENAKDADVVCIFTDSMMTKEIINLLPNLKSIITRSTGFDHVDVVYANSKNIKVCNVPAYGSETVAEFTFALILTLSRKVREATSALKENGDYTVPKNVKGFDLNGKTLGVVGTGKIGKNVIKIAHGFGMNVVAYDLYPDLALSKENNFIYKSLPEVLAQSDIITLHAPYTKENHHLINKDNISSFKKGAYLINTARGELLEIEALIAGLQNGTIAGAGLDVLEGERLFKKGDKIPFLDMPNVVMTPHVAFDTKEAEIRIIHTTADNIKGFISGLQLI